MKATYIGKTKPDLSLLDVGDGSVDLESFSDSFATFWAQVVGRKAAKSKGMQILAVRERIRRGYGNGMLEKQRISAKQSHF